VTLRNHGSGTVSLTGWRLGNLAGNEWRLDGLGNLAAGPEATSLRARQKVALTNGGDSVSLIDPADVVQQTVTYGQAEEGEETIPVTEQPPPHVPAGCKHSQSVRADASLPSTRPLTSHQRSPSPNPGQRTGR